ncbi:hypothetical protein, partial [Lunatimonas salinarum]|uniref:hypothetical protein n=1 Tax=Lunatimonas salinarum TaxID=1774590 RepID=UPI001ADF98FA
LGWSKTLLQVFLIPSRNEGDKSISIFLRVLAPLREPLCRIACQCKWFDVHLLFQKKEVISGFRILHPVGRWGFYLD